MPNPKIPSGISSEKAQNALQRLGFIFKRQKGSHIVMTRTYPDTDQTDTMILIQGNEMAKGTLKANLKKANVEIEDFLENLR